MCRSPVALWGGVSPCGLVSEATASVSYDAIVQQQLGIRATHCGRNGLLVAVRTYERREGLPGRDEKAPDEAKMPASKR